MDAVAGGGTIPPDRNPEAPIGRCASLVRYSGADATQTPGRTPMHKRPNGGFHRISKRKSPASDVLTGPVQSNTMLDFRVDQAASRR
ncbi:hypothetical protein [Bradyrhizobium sp. th.b2]|uniref:hypothetical protein n=1 Tax=Bradyrhizobium sp. th-b2 TaxID=172088 RepID=UPI0012EB19F8|nr:hypothetical protein [Bradyrhizobium sp. th.b2]